MKMPFKQVVVVVECDLCNGESYLYNDDGGHCICPKCKGAGEVEVTALEPTGIPHEHYD